LFFASSNYIVFSILVVYSS